MCVDMTEDLKFREWGLKGKWYTVKSKTVTIPDPKGKWTHCDQFCIFPDVLHASTGVYVYTGCTFYKQCNSEKEKDHNKSLLFCIFDIHTYPLKVHNET